MSQTHNTYLKKSNEQNQKENEKNDIKIGLDKIFILKNHIVRYTKLDSIYIHNQEKHSKQIELQACDIQ